MKHILMTSSPVLSGKARKFGFNYRRIAIVRLKDGFDDRPKMISSRAVGVDAIIEDRTVHVGKSERSEGFRTLREMEQRCAALNQS